MGSGADGMHRREIEGRFVKIAEQIGRTVQEKNDNYGDSFFKCGEFLRLLYPNGIPVEKYGDALATVRIFDKLMRIATRKNAYGESPFADIAGYGILGYAKELPPVPVDDTYRP